MRNLDNELVENPYEYEKTRMREVLLDILLICDRGFVDEVTVDDAVRVLERIAGVCVGALNLSGDPWHMAHHKRRGREEE